MKRTNYLVAVISCCLALVACASTKEEQARADSKDSLERALAENQTARNDHARQQAAIRYQSQQMKSLRSKDGKPDGSGKPN